jgi:hypothetical protein
MHASCTSVCVLAWQPPLAAAVCRDWKAVYAGKGEQQFHSVSLELRQKLLTCGSKSTLYSAVVASPETARWAHGCGLKTHSCKNLQVIAGFYADLQRLALLQELGMPLGNTVINAVALSGRLPILEHVLSNVHEQVLDAIGLSQFAARSGSISMLKWLTAKGSCYFNHSVCAAAAAGGQLEALRYLRSEGTSWSQAQIAGYAARSGSIELVEWLLQQEGVQMNAAMLACAAGAGQIAMCEYLRSSGCDWNADACSRAIAYREMDTLRWLRERGCPWNVRTVCEMAATKGFTDVLEYVAEQGEVLDAALLTAAPNCAGACDRLQTAQWLRQHGAQWPAALGFSGNTINHKRWWSGESLAWARANGCTSPTVQL